MLVVIQDANILIDLEKCDLLGHYFAIERFDNRTTDFVLREVPPAVVEFAKSGRLHVEWLDATELAALLEFKARQSPGLSLVDCSVFQMAVERRAVLLTGDGKLRSCAEIAGVEVHGILWLMEQIIFDGVLEAAPVAERLEKLMKINRRLPVEECQRRLRIWKAGA